MTHYTGEDRRDPAGWHMDKKVPISIVIGMLMQVLVASWYAGKLDSRVLSLEEKQVSIVTAQHERDERQDKAGQDNDRLIREELRDINAKLDRLIERRNQK